MSKDCPEPRRERGERGGDRGGYKRQRNDDGGSNRRFDNANESAWNAEKQTDGWGKQGEASQGGGWGDSHS